MPVIQAALLSRAWLSGPMILTPLRCAWKLMVRARTERRRSGESLAGTRQGQQRRSGSARAQEEDAARGYLSRDEDAPELREAVGEAGPRTRRGRAPLPQAAAQAHGARRLLGHTRHDR